MFLDYIKYEFNTLVYCMHIVCLASLTRQLFSKIISGVTVLSLRTACGTMVNLITKRGRSGAWKSPASTNGPIAIVD